MRLGVRLGRIGGVAGGVPEVQLWAWLGAPGVQIWCG